MLVLLPMSWPKGQKKKNSYFKENEIYLKKNNTTAFHLVFSFQVLSYFKFIVNIVHY